MKVFSFIFVAFFSGLSFAGGWQGYSTIDGYVIEGDENNPKFYVNMSVDKQPDGCTGNVSWERIYTNTEKGKMMVSMVLAAYATKQQAQLLLSGCDEMGRNVIRGIMTK